MKAAKLRMYAFGVFGVLEVVDREGEGLLGSLCSQRFRLEENGVPDEENALILGSRRAAVCLAGSAVSAVRPWVVRSFAPVDGEATGLDSGVPFVGVVSCPVGDQAVGLRHQGGGGVPYLFCIGSDVEGSPAGCQAPGLSCLLPSLLRMRGQ